MKTNKQKLNSIEERKKFLKKELEYLDLLDPLREYKNNIKFNIENLNIQSSYILKHLKHCCLKEDKFITRKQMEKYISSIKQFEDVESSIHFSNIEFVDILNKVHKYDNSSGIVTNNEENKIDVNNEYCVVSFKENSPNYDLYHSWSYFICTNIRVKGFINIVFDEDWKENINSEELLNLLKLIEYKSSYEYMLSLLD